MGKQRAARARDRWERQQQKSQNRRTRRMEEQEETGLNSAVRAVLGPTPDLTFQNFRSGMQLLADNAQRASEAFQNFAQTPVVRQAMEAVGQQIQQEARQRRVRRLSDFIPVRQSEDSPSPVVYAAYDEAVSMNEEQFIALSRYMAPPSRVRQEGLIYHHEFQMEPVMRIEPINIQLEAQITEYGRRLLSQQAERMRRSIEAQILGVPPADLENQPASTAQQGTSAENFRQAFNRIMDIAEPKPKPPEEIDQMRAKVARAQKLLQDTSQLLSRVVAGLEVTPEEARALKARVDAGVAAFK